MTVTPAGAGAGPVSTTVADADLPPITSEGLRTIDDGVGSASTMSVADTSVG